MSPAERRRIWAYGLTSRVPRTPPAYGSAEWLSLPDGPEKVAAVVLAAEKFAIDWEAKKALEDQEFAADRADRAGWNSQAARFRRDPRIAADVEREWREWAGGAA